MSNFNTVPRIYSPRSQQNLSQTVKTSASVGTLYPIYVQEIYPGDTFKVNTSFVARLTSSYIRPVMDNLFVDMYYFFVPSRLVFDKFAEIFGENNSGEWAQTQPVSAPVTAVEQKVSSKTIADYMGLPVGDVPKGINIIPFRAFAKIYNDWFRDQNLVDPVFIHKDGFNIEESFNNLNWTPANYMGKLPKVAKFHDVFTSSLPNTQKSNTPAYVPLAGFVPISADPERLFQLGANPRISTTAYDGSALSFWTPGNVSGNGQRDVYALPNAVSTPATTYDIKATNLGVSLADAGVLTVPDLRYAFQLQRILERSARSGTRYTEYLLSAFGVQSPDARLQRSEYLGGKRVPLSTQQVAQTTRGEADYDELGSLGAFSLTNGQCGYTKGFVEHGFVIGVMCIRQHHTYQQGIEKFWQRSDRFDYYDPALAHISEQPVYRSEIYAAGESDVKDHIFGYQEAWYDLRNRMDYVTGDMRSDAENSLDIWHFADDYASSPYLNQTFIEEGPENVDRTIAVPSTSLDQFIFDIYHHSSSIRRIPARSEPGLIDHY